MSIGPISYAASLRMLRNYGVTVSLRGDWPHRLEWSTSLDQSLNAKRIIPKHVVVLEKRRARNHPQ